MSKLYLTEVELIGPYEKVRECKEWLIEDLLCKKLERHWPMRSDLNFGDIRHLTFCFETEWDPDLEVVARLLYSFRNGGHPALQVNWLSLGESEDLRAHVIVSFPPA